MNDKNDRNRRNNTAPCVTICDESAVLEAEADQAAKIDALTEAAETAQRRACDFASPVCINANQIYDSCRDRDCVKDSRVYLTAQGQELLENAINVKLKNAEIIWVYSDVEPLSFNSGYFSVDLKFFVCVTLDVFSGVSAPTTIKGLSTFDKRIILYGSEGSSKVFKSTVNCDGDISGKWMTACNPTVVIETVDPIALSAKIVDEECCCCESQDAVCLARKMFPETICECFDGDLVVDDFARQVQVSYGLFFLVRLERDTQLLVDAVDFCIPTQECPSATSNNPCELFNDIRFPIDEFFPSLKGKSTNNKRSGNGCACSCGC